jgi:hypothetical protein
MDGLDAAAGGPAVDWLWHGYLGRGNLTLLTSLWKAGKTTLLAGLLQHLAAAGEFLGLACSPAQALVVSEESPEHWSARLRTMPIGPHARLMSRPFRGRPNVDAWNALVGHALELRSAGALDLFVVDPLASFLPGRSDSDAGTLLTMLQPLQRLAAGGAAVLVLHHPRKQAADAGSAARGSGALLGFVDIILELHRYGKLQSEGCRRKLVGLSRHRETPRLTVYDYDPAAGTFTGLGDPLERRFRENWSALRTILAGRKFAATHHELLTDWPAERDPPSPGVLYDWLSRAFAEGHVRREGKGRRNEPYRWRLPNAADEYWNRGELPPMEVVG